MLRCSKMDIWQPWAAAQGPATMRNGKLAAAPAISRDGRSRGGMQPRSVGVAARNPPMHSPQALRTVAPLRRTAPPTVLGLRYRTRRWPPCGADAEGVWMELC